MAKMAKIRPKMAKMRPKMAKMRAMMAKMKPKMAKIRRIIRTSRAQHPHIPSIKDQVGPPKKPTKNTPVHAYIYICALGAGDQQLRKKIRKKGVQDWEMNVQGLEVEC